MDRVTDMNSLDSTVPADSKYSTARTSTKAATGRSSFAGKLCSALCRFALFASVILVVAWLSGGVFFNKNPQQGPPAPSVVLNPIEAVHVGDRVFADNPDEQGSQATKVDPATWRKLTLRAETRWEDGTLDVINVETLQSPDWIEAHHAQVGATVPLPLDLLEMGLPEDLRATVIANSPCPPIRAGPGRIVLTTVNHLNNDVRELVVKDGSGKNENIRTTGLHKFYREPDGAWVSACDLVPSSEIGGRLGRLTVVSNKPLPGVYRVYNMTVEGEHVYYVSGLGALAHNNGCAVVDFTSELEISGRAARRHLRRAMGAGGGQAHHIIPWQMRTHTIVKRAARGGFNMNGANNGIRLNITQHLGSHPKYSAAVLRKLDAILEKNPNISAAAAANQLQRYVDQLYKGLQRSSSRLR